MAMSNHKKSWFLTATLCILCFAGGLGATKLLPRHPLPAICPMPSLPPVPPCQPSPPPAPPSHASAAEPVLPSSPLKGPPSAQTAEQLQQLLAQLDKAVASLRKDHEALQKEWNDVRPLSVAQKASVEKIKQDLNFVYEKIDRTKALDDISTMVLKTEIKRDKSLALVARLTETPFGRLSLVVEETREPLQRLVLTVPKSLETAAQCVVHTQDAAKLLAHQREQLGALQKTLRPLKELSSSL